MQMDAEQVADHIKKGHTVAAPAMNWIAGHAVLEQELLGMLDRALEGLTSSSALVRKKVQREVEDYLKEWKR